MSRHLIVMKLSNWKRRNQFCPCLCCCHCSKSVNQEHDPLSPCRGKDWNYIALMVDYFELPQRVAEGWRQVLVTRLYLVQENPSRPSTSAAFIFFYCSSTLRPLTGRGVEECCALHHQVSLSALPTLARCVLSFVSTFILRGGSHHSDKQLSLEYLLSWHLSEIVLNLPYNDTSRHSIFHWHHIWPI